MNKVTITVVDNITQKSNIVYIGSEDNVSRLVDEWTDNFRNVSVLRNDVSVIIKLS